MNPGLLAPGYAPPVMPRPLLGQPQPVPMPYGRGGDPFWRNTSLLLRMDGPHGSRSFTDSSPYTLTVTNVGSPTIDQSQFVYGSSGQLNTGATTDAVTVPNSTGRFDVGTGDFTVESWCRFTAIGASSAAQRIILSCGSSGMAVAFWNNRIRLAKADVANVIDYGSTAITTGSWFHWAITRSGSTLRFFVNGSIIGSTTYSTTLTPTGSTTFVGNYHNAGAPGVVGNIDDFRFTLGVSRYTANFPPPTAPFPIGYQ